MLIKNGINKINKNGFTLIELLVVIAIISLLSSFVIVSLNNARRKAQDVKAAAELHTVYTALQSYYNDHNGKYPPNPIHGQACWFGRSNDGQSQSGCLTQLVDEGYLPALPRALPTYYRDYGFYFYYDYNSPINIIGQTPKNVAVIKAFLNAKPNWPNCVFNDGWWCSDLSSDNIYNYCVCMED
jgi:prepilin-type N-terminal cleavage/methylation domain-containing protein